VPAVRAYCRAIWTATLCGGCIGADDCIAIAENTTDAIESRTSIWLRARVSSRFCFCNQVITDGNMPALPVGKPRQCGLPAEVAQQWEMSFEQWEIALAGSGCRS
jgi:hypothetical protein